MIPFNPGDLVEAIDDHISGIVIRIESGLVVFEDEHGFEFSMPAASLILKSSQNLHLNIGHDDIKEALTQNAESKRPKTSQSHLRNSERSFTVDLHIDKLVDSTKGMSNFDMLNLQIDTAKRQLEFAIQKRMLKIVFIHGVGEGVLKMELYTLLRRYDNVNFYDADYRAYGLGATEVKIFQNT